MWFLLVAAVPVATPWRASAATDIIVTAIKLVDGNFNPITPTVGVPFYVEVDYDYDNPVCTDYTISRIVNGWTNIALPVNYGCGYSGKNTSWEHVYGEWLMYNLRALVIEHLRFSVYHQSPSAISSNF
jgi:hypothetical protein